jgi:hypothetical protein
MRDGALRWWTPDFNGVIEVILLPKAVSDRHYQCPVLRQVHSENGHCRRSICTVNDYNVVFSIGPSDATSSTNGGNT